MLPGTRERFMLPSRYALLKRLGAGSYGTVALAEDLERTGRLVAIKKVRNAFRDPVDGRRILREVSCTRLIVVWIVCGTS